MRSRGVSMRLYTKEKGREERHTTNAGILNATKFLLKLGILKIIIIFTRTRGLICEMNVGERLLKKATC